MKTLAVHRFWLSLLALAAFLFVVGLPVLNVLQDDAQQTSDRLALNTKEAQQTLLRTRDDIAQAKQLDGHLKPSDIDHILSPVDRLQTMNAIERESKSLHLAHFSYILSPEQKVTTANPPLASSVLTLGADAALDTDATAFVERILTSLPGRTRLLQLTLERNDDSTATLQAENLHMTAIFEWLSNGAEATLVGQK